MSPRSKGKQVTPRSLITAGLLFGYSAGHRYLADESAEGHGLDVVSYDLDGWI